MRTLTNKVAVRIVLCLVVFSAEGCVGKYRVCWRTIKPPIQEKEIKTLVENCKPGYVAVRLKSGEKVNGWIHSVEKDRFLLSRDRGTMDINFRDVESITPKGNPMGWVYLPIYLFIIGAIIWGVVN